LLRIAGADPSRTQYVGVAAAILEELVQENPDLPGHVYRNLALALELRGLHDAGQRARAATAWRKYLETAPKGDPQTRAIEREVERLSRE
jgi:hypothetical protein